MTHIQNSCETVQGLSSNELRLDSHIRHWWVPPAVLDYTPRYLKLALPRFSIAHLLFSYVFNQLI